MRAAAAGFAPRMRAESGVSTTSVMEVAVKYKVILHETEEGYSVHCPGLPGCWSQGETEEDALQNITDAIEEYLAAVEEITRTENVREVEVPV